MIIKLRRIDGVTLRTFDHTTDYDLTRYPIIELTSEEYRARVVLKVPDGCYIIVALDESEEQNEP